MTETKDDVLEKWLNTIGAYDTEFKKWEARSNKIVKRYRDDNRISSTNDSVRFNILWSNIQALTPAVYSKLPTADVRRRFGDNDQVGRVASQLLERALDFEIEHYPDFRSMMTNVVRDRFLGGRGTAWVRYEPHIKQQSIPDDGLQITEDADDEEVPEEIEYECAPSDYVHWKDFGHSIARTWEEVTCVWRWVYMTKESMAERFGEKEAKKIPLDCGAKTLNSYNQTSKEYNRAKICELWDKESGKVYWFSKNSRNIIDEREDPLGLEGFFPCSIPLYSTLTSDSLIPIPDYVLYQDQATELDIIADRIDGLIKALRVRGVYDASQPALQRLLTEGDNNTLIPVDKWMAFSEKGGLQGSIQLLPLEVIAQTLINLYAAHKNVTQQIYEITGISDIIRGQTSASETATAQQIKGQYAGLRLRSLQEEVALFASSIIKLKAQIICKHFQPETILNYAAASQMSDADKQLIPQALELLENPLYNFRIDIEADSLVQIDENQNKQDRIEFIAAFGGFITQAMPVVQSVPELAPMIIEIMKFGVGGFKQAKSIEGTINSAMEQLKANQQQPKEPQPDPEQMKLQAHTQIEQAKMQLEQAKLQTDIQIEQMKAEMSTTESTNVEAYNRWKDELEAATKVLIARIGANPGMDLPLIEAQQAASERITLELGDHVTQAMNRMADMQGQTLESIGGVMQALTRPKRIIRGVDGRAAGVETL
jgi:hypothetical protein